MAPRDTPANTTIPAVIPAISRGFNPLAIPGAILRLPPPPAREAPFSWLPEAEAPVLCPQIGQYMLSSSIFLPHLLQNIPYSCPFFRFTEILAPPRTG